MIKYSKNEKEEIFSRKKKEQNFCYWKGETKKWERIENKIIIVRKEERKSKKKNEALNNEVKIKILNKNK